MTTSAWMSTNRGRARLLAAALSAVTLVGGGFTSAVRAHAAPPAASAKPGRSVNAAPAASAYTAMVPQRLLDTRPRPDGSNQSLPAGFRIGLTVTGGATGVPVGAAAVVLNVTSVNNQGAGYLQVFPAGTSTGASAVNYYYSSELTQNLVTVQTPADGTGAVFILSSAADDVVVDEEGYYTTPSGTAGLYVPLNPARITDTRAGSGLPNAGQTQMGGSVLNVQVTGQGGVPASGVSAAVLNVTVTNDQHAGYVQAYPTGTPRPVAPPTSNVNYNGVQAVFGGAQLVSTRVIVPLGTGGQVSLFTSSGPTDLVVDVNGFFTDASTGAPPGHTFTALTPTRIADTRNGVAIAAFGTVSMQVGGMGGVSAAASAAVLNVTIDKTTAVTGPGSGFITVFPTAGQMPLASDINFGPSSIVPAAVYATLSPTGQVQIYNGSASPINVVVDVYGYFN